MRQLRFGSYSMAATLASKSSLFRRKSMMRYCCLCPPPRWRAVFRPLLLRPPVWCLGPMSDFSGVVLVTSEKSETVWNRRPGLVGLRLRMAMVLLCLVLLCLEEFDGVAGGEGDVRALGSGPLTHGRGPAVAL